MLCSQTTQIPLETLDNLDTKSQNILLREYWKLILWHYQNLFPIIFFFSFGHNFPFNLTQINKSFGFLTEMHS